MISTSRVYHKDGHQDGIEVQPRKKEIGPFSFPFISGLGSLSKHNRRSSMHESRNMHTLHHMSPFE